MSWITSSSVAAHAHPAWISGRSAVTARPRFNAHENACQYLRPLRQQKTLPLSLTSGKPSTIGHYLENRGIQQRCKREVAAFSSSSGGENQGDVAQNQSAPSESTADNDFEGDGEMGLEAEDDDIIFDYDEVEDEDHDDYDDETIDIDDFELFDDELLLQIDDNFIVAARKLDQFDEGWEGGFEEDGMEFRNIDDETLLEILGLPDEESTKKDIPSEDDLDESSADENPNEGGEEMDAQNDGSKDKSLEVPEAELSPSSTPIFTPLENALLQGVVPADAGVGSGRLPGDFGWDPLGLSSKDYFKKSQRFLLNRLPEREKLDNGDGGAVPPIRRSVADQDARPPALILRDYREAEIRHGRLAMLAAILWPLEELLDRILIPDVFGSTTVIYGGPTLPFVPLIMVFIMLNLGYLDIFAKIVKEEESGDAFLPGECFWDPLKILDGAPDDMKRNMQQRELFNGRIAMLTVLMFAFEEAVTHTPLITHNLNQYLFQPAYEFPRIQEWFDMRFSSPSSTLTFPETGGTVDFI